jgi:hypothetical protein
MLVLALLVTGAFVSAASTTNVEKGLDSTKTELKDAAKHKYLILTATVDPKKATGTVTCYGEFPGDGSFSNVGSSTVTAGVAELSLAPPPGKGWDILGLTDLRYCGS